MKNIISGLLLIGTFAFANKNTKKCFEDVCVGENVYVTYVESDGFQKFQSQLGTVSSIDSGKFILRFANGEYGTGWERHNISKLEGCSISDKKHCVGDNVYRREADDTVSHGKVVGIQSNSRNRIVIRFTAGLGAIWGNQDANDVKLYSGTGNTSKFSIGDIALLTDGTSTRAEILGISSKGLYAIKFLSGPGANHIRAGWGDQHLALLAASSTITTKLYEATDGKIYCGKFSSLGELLITIDPSFCPAAKLELRNDQCGLIAPDGKVTAIVSRRYCPANLPSLEEINRELALPEGTQVVIKDKLIIPRNKGCAAAQESTEDTQCYVCQSNAIVNGTLYTNESILEISSSVMSEDRKAIHLKLVNSEELERITCFSKTGKTLNIKSFEDLQKAINASGLHFKDPGLVEKTVGRKAGEG